MPPIPTYDQAYGQLANVYDPQTAVVNSQLADLPNQEQATLSSLDQAKVNAFRDITSSANSKGMLFSGFTPDQQAQYVGTKYLPAVAAAKTATTNAKNSLLDKINQINANRASQALGTVSSAQNAAAKVQAAAIKASSAAPKALSQTQVSAAIRQGLGSVRGKDGYVAPQDYAAAYKDWVNAGYSGSTFDNYFGDLMDPKNGYYQYAKTKA